MLQLSTRHALTLKARLFRGFGDPSRLAVLEALRDGPKSVGQIMEAAGLSQPNTSNHLSCLYDCGLVSRRQQGRYVYYTLADSRVAELLQIADTLLADVARGVNECTRYGAAPEGSRADND